MLVFNCACKEKTPTEPSTTPTTQAEKTLIPRQTFAPTPVPTHSLYCEYEKDIDSFLQITEDYWAKKNSTNPCNVGVIDTFKSQRYFYAFATLTEKNTPITITNKVYQFLIEDEKLKLVASKNFPELSNEYVYDFMYAFLNGETVFFSRCGKIYAYKNNGEEIFECESFEDIDKPDYEKIRTRPTKFIFEFSNGKALTKDVNDTKVMFCVDGEVNVKNLTVFSGTRQLTNANIVNYQIPEFYHFYKADNLQVY
jgi:hypothetical protein